MFLVIMFRSDDWENWPKIGLVLPYNLRKNKYHSRDLSSTCLFFYKINKFHVFWPILKFSLYNHYIIGQNPRSVSFFAIFCHFQISTAFDTVFLWTCLTTKIKIWFSTFYLKYLHSYIVCASFLKISINLMNFCCFRDFKIICQKKKKSRNIEFHGPIIHQTKAD